MVVGGAVTLSNDGGRVGGAGDFSTMFDFFQNFYQLRNRYSRERFKT
jgi:hypothetical protein